LTLNSSTISDIWGRKIKWALRCWRVCDWKRIIFYSLLAHNLFSSWSISLLPCWPSKELPILCLLRIATMLVESLMMIVASIVPDFLMGIITGAGIQGVMMLNRGFFRLPDDLPKPFWRYPMYYIAFHKYANQGFYKNEFEGLMFPNNQAGGPPTITGDYGPV
jgi:hypothetical protein